VICSRILDFKEGFFDMYKNSVIRVAKKLINRGKIGKYIWAIGQLLDYKRVQFNSLIENLFLLIPYKEDFSKLLAKAVQYGEEGRLKVVPETIWIAGTNSCNIRCVMCHDHVGKNGEYITKEEAKIILSTKESSGAVYFGKVKTLHLTSGESLLHPELATIIKTFKERFSDSGVMLFTNATLPIVGNVKEAILNIDYLYISIDGATKDVYEDIRRGANFNNVIKNIQDIIQCRKEANVSNKNVGIAFVATATNLHQLSSIVRIAHDFGIPRVGAFEVEKRTGINKAYEPAKYDLSNLPKELIRKYLQEAKKVANRLNVNLLLTTDLSDKMIEPKHLTKVTKSDNKEGDVSDFKSSDLPAYDVVNRTLNPTKSFKKSVSMCSITWKASPFIVKNHSGVFPQLVCSHMPLGKQLASMENIPDLLGKNYIDIFNYPFYWNIRKGFTDGSIAEGACNGCKYYGMMQWTSEEKNRLLKAVREVKKQGSKK
jgi:MoaA/NifB/PqqE/SkfB family radical SAM enzyme